MRTIEIKVYQFDELSEKAKENAREWWLHNGLDDYWWESIYYDAEQVGLKITSFDLDRNRHAKGEFILGADDVARNILSDHGEGCETYKTAQTFMEGCKALEERAKMEGKDGDEDYWFSDEISELENEFLKSIIEDYSIMLQNEYEYMCSDEYIDESIRNNEYEFYVNGEII